MMEQEINFDLPIIDVNLIKQKFNISPDEEELILNMIYNPVNGKGLLRATRPKQSGENSWLWRSIMLMCSPEEKFHSVATMLDSYISEYDESSVIENRLNLLLEKILSTLDDSDKHGSNSWKEAIGTE